MKSKKKKYKSRPIKFSVKRKWFLSIFFALILLVAWHYRYPIYYLVFQYSSSSPVTKKTPVTHQLRIFDVLSHHKKKQFGVDVSHYQGKINWDKAIKIQDSFPISFVFVRATAGKNRIDRQFKRNWKQVKNKELIRGAYHYYRPNENSILQANNFINAVRLEKGDLPPVLDIEDIPRVQSMENLKKGLKKWLAKVENHYKMKPIIYSGESFYNDFLYYEFSEYTCWIANYNFHVENIDKDWNFWQFTDKGSVTGIDELVDVNIYNGQLIELRGLTKK